MATFTWCQQKDIAWWEEKEGTQIKIITVVRYYITRTSKTLVIGMLACRCDITSNQLSELDNHEVFVAGGGWEGAAMVKGYA